MSILKKNHAGTAKKIFLVSFTILFIMSAVSCFSPEGKFYTSTDKDYQTAVDTVNAGWEKYTALDTSRLISSFFVECDAAGKIYRLGTENLLEVKGLFSNSPSLYRKNTSTSLQGDISTVTLTEESFYRNGIIYTERYGSAFSAPLEASRFVEYTNYSDLSVNSAYLSPSNFSEAKIYKSSGKAFEIVFKGENDALKTGIIAFIGLDQTSYQYEIYDVSLRAVFNEDGLISCVKLLFSVDYYDTPDARLTYEGVFSQTVETGDAVNPASPPSSVTYNQISDIFLLSAVTDSGFSAIADASGIDAVYSKYVKVSDTKQSYILDEKVNFTGKFSEGSFLYGNIDRENLSTPEKKKETSKGIFIDSFGYHERSYDFVASEYGTPTDNAEHDYTSSSMIAILISTLSSETLLENDLVFREITENTDDYVTFSFSLSSSVWKYYTVYLMSSFSSDSSTEIDLSSSSVMLAKNSVRVTVRKSDLCVIGQTIEFSAIVDGMITVEHNFSMKINSTDENVTVLNQSDFTGSIESGS